MVQMNLSFSFSHTEFNLHIANHFVRTHDVFFSHITSVDVSFLIGTVESFVRLLSSGNVGIAKCQLLRRLEKSLALSSVMCF